MRPALLAFCAIASGLPAAFSLWLAARPLAEWPALAPWGAGAALGAVAAVFVLMAHAARARRPAAWRAGWIAALGVATVAAAPLYVALYVRPEASPKQPAG